MNIATLKTTVIVDSNMSVKGLLGCIISVLTFMGCRKLGAGWFDAILVTVMIDMIFNMIWGMHHRNNNKEIN